MFYLTYIIYKRVIVSYIHAMVVASVFTCNIPQFATLSLLSPLARSRQRLARLVAVTISADSCLSTTGTRHPPPSPSITPVQYIQYIQYSIVQYCLSTTLTLSPCTSPGIYTGTFKQVGWQIGIASLLILVISNPNPGSHTFAFGVINQLAKMNQNPKMCGHFLHCIIFYIINVIYNQLEKLEAAKAAWLVCLSSLSLTGPYWALLGCTGL